MATPDGIVGSISVYNADPQTGTAEVGYGVHPEHRGRGYATEALRGLAGHLLGTGVLNKIRLRARPDNIASLRVAEKAGFVKEASSRKGWSPGPRWTRTASTTWWCSVWSARTRGPSGARARRRRTGSRACRPTGSWTWRLTGPWTWRRTRFPGVAADRSQTWRRTGP